MTEEIARRGQSHKAWHPKGEFRIHPGLRRNCSICLCDPNHGYIKGRKDETLDATNIDDTKYH